MHRLPHDGRCAFRGTTSPIGGSANSAPSGEIRGPQSPTDPVPGAVHNRCGLTALVMGLVGISSNPSFFDLQDLSYGESRPPLTFSVSPIT